MRDGVSPYEALIADILLGGYKPKVVTVDENNEIYLSIKDTAHITQLSPERIRGLVREKRLDAIKPGGHDLFISLTSAHRYITEGRKQAGRPPKDPF